MTYQSHREMNNRLFSVLRKKGSRILYQVTCTVQYVLTNSIQACSIRHIMSVIPKMREVNMNLHESITMTHQWTKEASEQPSISLFLGRKDDESPMNFKCQLFLGSFRMMNGNSIFDLKVRRLQHNLFAFPFVAILHFQLCTKIFVGDSP